MSIFGKIKHGIRHAAHEVKHTADKAVHKTEHAAEHAADQVSHGADQAVDAVKDAANKTREGINDMANIGDEIKKEILGALKSAENAAVSAIKDAEKSATGELKKLGNEIKKEIEDEVSKIESALESKAAKEVLEDLVDTIRALSPDSIQIELGPVQLDLGNLEAKVEHFVKWSKNPPKNRETWIAFVNDVTPDSLSLVESIGLGLIVQSDDAKIGLTETWGSDKVLDRLDKILERAGIH
jgi:flagellar capping protein FliD